MSKKKHSNTEALRDEFAGQLSHAIKDISKNMAAEKLGISRQMLKRACDEWNLSLSIKGFSFSGEAFAGQPKPRLRAKEPPQASLLDLLEKLSKDQLEAQIVGREGDSFYLKLRIKVAA